MVLLLIHEVYLFFLILLPTARRKWQGAVCYLVAGGVKPQQRHNGYKMQHSGETLRKTQSLGEKYSIIEGTQIVATSPYLEIFRTWLTWSSFEWEIRLSDLQGSLPTIISVILSVEFAHFDIKKNKIKSLLSWSCQHIKWPSNQRPAILEKWAFRSRNNSVSVQ